MILPIIAPKTEYFHKGCMNNLYNHVQQEGGRGQQTVHFMQ